jgi:hypothetical protein
MTIASAVEGSCLVIFRSSVPPALSSGQVLAIKPVSDEPETMAEAGISVSASHALPSQVASDEPHGDEP